MRDDDALVQVAEDVHRLTQGVINFHLIEDGGKLALVYAGAPRDWEALVRTLAALGRTLDGLECVVLTHAHSDHTGFAERARSETCDGSDPRSRRRGREDGRRGPQIAPDGLNRDSERALRSLDTLATVPAELVLPGQGDPWTGGIAEAVRLAKAAGR